MSNRQTELLENELGAGWTSELITAIGAEVKAVKATRGKVAQIKVNGAYNVTLKDNATAKWAVLNNEAKDFSNCPIECATSINLDFGGAGSAWIIYK